LTTFYDISTEKVVSLLSTSKAGITNEEANKRIEKYGYNELAKKKDSNPIFLFLEQFKNFLIILLMVAIIISVFLKEFLEASAMFSIVIISAALGFFQEYRAEKAIEALEKIAAPTANVIRKGRQIIIQAKEIVPGDIVLLEAGDIVPADSRIIEAASMHIDEAALTGESVPSEKEIKKLKSNIRVTEQKNMAFMGTIVTYGKGTVIVTSTGMSTEFGKIATSIQSTKEVHTPLQIKFEQMAKQIGFAVLALVFIVFLGGILQGDVSIAKMFIFALSLAVAAVPSSLPAIVTISLALGAKTLATKKMIIKKLPAAESLGSVTTICSDKTGTITKNQMTVTKLYTNDAVISVSGTGYNPEGGFSTKGEEVDTKKIELLLRTGYLCNGAKLNKSKENNRWEVIGDPTEGSLITLARKGNLSDEAIKDDFQLIQEFPFDSERKMMSVVYKKSGTRDNTAYIKGAPDILLKDCDRIIKNGKVQKLTEKERIKILEMNEHFATDALRVLAFAYKDLPPTKKYEMNYVEEKLIFIGLAGMIDPPREEVKVAIPQCEAAGINVMIITGDHAATTTAVAKQIGLFREGDLVLTGDDVEKMTDKQLTEVINKVRIIARALPIQKSKVVDALKAKGHVVAMTGDGVNDAPALKKADIGIAMGVTGTGVAKEVSKAILSDDNFATIVNAVSEGRNIYDKIIKSTRYLLSCNAGEIIVVFMAIMLRFPLPITPLQILLMNLVTDGAPAIGLGFEPADEGVMKRQPRNPKERAITGHSLMMIVLFGLVMGAGTLFIFKLYSDQSLDLARTAAFTTLVMFEMFAVLASRSLEPFKKFNPFTNKWLALGVISSLALQIAIIYLAPLQTIFNTVALSLIDWARIIAISSLGYVFMEISKIFIRRSESNNNQKAYKPQKQITTHAT
jgi:P-type Ca2+ transporter type 2C